MRPKPSQPQSGELFVSRLDEPINMRHPLVKLAALIDWAEIERTFAVSFTSARGRPALPPRLVAGLLYLQHAFNASDEAVVTTWVENPYWQFFCAIEPAIGHMKMDGRLGRNPLQGAPGDALQATPYAQRAAR